MTDKEKIEVKKKDTNDEQKEETKKSRELTIKRENPFSLFQEMDRMFDDLRSNFFNDDWWPFSRRYRPFSLTIRDDEPLFRTPLSNISETKDAYNITAE